MKPEKIPSCQCAEPKTEKPHLDDAAVDWCENCGLMII